MTFDYQRHNRRMVKRFLWLLGLDKAYAEAAIEAYAKHPDSPNPNILCDVHAEQARRLIQPTSTSQNSSVNTDRNARPTTSGRT
ncbi:MAG: hypothetical protein H7293_08890 [Candidatus Saccharibacteria bacterium]|nr:hypothetical protein [Rhodoferax sp.]